MIRGVGAARVTSHGPFIKDSSSYMIANTSPNLPLPRDQIHQQFSSQLSLLKDNSFKVPASQSKYHSTTMYNHNPHHGFQTRMLVASNQKANGPKSGATPTDFSTLGGQGSNNGGSIKHHYKTQ